MTVLTKQGNLSRQLANNYIEFTLGSTINFWCTCCEKGG
ncbi:protein of unknown function [Moritella yayanosii]|uniref:Uncharacterized protein n=1 Tax=Moritella yayanosii TaxID=69539 RepID=A0A330LRE2_9GAMM|nr:protein of unknown function [Moritella yayanosii]